MGNTLSSRLNKLNAQQRNQLINNAELVLGVPTRLDPIVQPLFHKDYARYSTSFLAYVLAKAYMSSAPLKYNVSSLPFHEGIEVLQSKTAKTSQVGLKALQYFLDSKAIENFGNTKMSWEAELHNAWMMSALESCAKTALDNKLGNSKPLPIDYNIKQAKTFTFKPEDVKALQQVVRGFLEHPLFSDSSKYSVEFKPSYHLAGLDRDPTSDFRVTSLANPKEVFLVDLRCTTSEIVGAKERKKSAESSTPPCVSAKFRGEYLLRLLANALLHEANAKGVSTVREVHMLLPFQSNWMYADLNNWDRTPLKEFLGV